ncbi:MAG: aminotransferase class I/II-fold pyridoxal phosphate-dependent enzyme [Clostridia bacterium]|nr:aminotransferase class I/II-fold pyridoxal phosphate-dependent enzyme [Clostridia bacterium]
MKFNEAILRLPESGVSVKKRVRDFAALYPDRTLIRLDQDLMNMPLPPAVTEGMKAAAEETGDPFGIRLNSPWSGYDSLKKAIVDHLQKRGVHVMENEVFITSGTESANDALSDLFGAENIVLLCDPVEKKLSLLHQCADRTVSFVRATPENAFRPAPDGTAADLIYLASPHPVTGVALDRETLKKWVDHANENGSIIFYDASLSEYIGGDDLPHSIYEIEGAKNCAIELFSFEKGYGVRELKIAYVIIPSTLTRNDTRIGQLFSLHQPFSETPPSYIMQKAAELLFSPEAREGTEKLIYRIKKVAKILSDGLTQAGVPHVGGEDSPFLWAQCPHGMSAWQCFDLLLEKAGCVVTPGFDFGYGGEHFFRLTAFGMPDEAKLAVEKLARAFEEKGKEPEGETEETVATRLFETL